MNVEREYFCRWIDPSMQQPLCAASEFCREFAPSFDSPKTEDAEDSSGQPPRLGAKLPLLSLSPQQLLSVFKWLASLEKNPLENDALSFALSPLFTQVRRGLSQRLVAKLGELRTPQLLAFMEALASVEPEDKATLR